jgi:acyl carrier protein
MVPSLYVMLERMPLTPNGKVDRKGLPSPEYGEVSQRAYEAPLGEVEEALAGIWCELLGLERVGREDHFFELGGHSLLVMQLVIRIRERFQVDIPLRTLFERPQLSALAESITAERLKLFDDGEVEDIENELSALSEEELLAMLTEDVKNEQ